MALFPIRKPAFGMEQRASPAPSTDAPPIRNVHWSPELVSDASAARKATVTRSNTITAPPLRRRPALVATSPLARAAAASPYVEF